MTIDEIIKGLEKAGDYLINAVGGYPLNEAEEKMINSIDASIEFFEWYRSQDLIKRDDAIREIMDIADYYNSKSEYSAEYAVLGCGNALGILPKAEPPKENE